jgi:hypothetical protein
MSEQTSKEYETDEKTICDFDNVTEIDADGWPCYSCGCNPNGENYRDSCAECEHINYCRHESCPATGCIDNNEGICEHEENEGNKCPENCPKEKVK